MADQPKPNKRLLKDAQAQHLASLFREEAAVKKPATQQADDHRAARAQSLNQAAHAKKATLVEAERQKLAELKQRNQASRSSAQTATSPPPPRPTPPRSSTTPAAGRPRQDGPALPELSQPGDQDDLVAETLRNAGARARQGRPPQSGQAPSSAPTTPPPARTARTAPPFPPASARPLRSAPPTQADKPLPPRRSTPPSPEELQALLRRMARPAPGGPSTRPESAESAPVVEAPPVNVEQTAERDRDRQAEIVEKLRTKEQQAKEQTPPIPQADQERAAEEPIPKAVVTIGKQNNAIDSAKLHHDIEVLREAVKIHDAQGQVSGVNNVQRQLPQHPLSQQARGQV